MAHFSCGSIVLRSGLGFTAQPKSLLHGARRRAPERQTRWAIPLSCAADPCPDFRRFATPPPAQARAGRAFGPPCRLARAGTGRGAPASRNADPMIGSGDDRLGPNQSKPVDTLGIILNRPPAGRTNPGGLGAPLNATARNRWSMIPKHVKRFSEKIRLRQRTKAG